MRWSQSAALFVTIAWWSEILVAAAAVLRLPVWPTRADSYQGMAREARILGAHTGVEVPHPRLLAFPPDESTIGVPAVMM